MSPKPFTFYPLSILHLGDDCGIKDSSKNLRVLWVRALLDNYGEIDDKVAGKLLPPSSSLVTSDYSKKLFQPIRKFAEWIASRTSFIDKSLDDFLEFNDGGECNVVLFGSGYDTRALRYRSKVSASKETKRRLVKQCAYLVKLILMLLILLSLSLSRRRLTSASSRLTFPRSPRGSRGFIIAMFKK